MTFTRRDLVLSLPNGEDQSFLIRQQSNLSVGTQLENIHAIQREISRRPIPVITPPRAFKLPKPANDNLLQDIVREISDIPYPRQRGKSWRVLFWIAAGLVIGMEVL